MTIALIFGSAYMLAAFSGCADSGSGYKNPATPFEENQDNQPNYQDLQPANPNGIKECSDAEFAQLVSWRNAVNKANAAIDSANKKKQPAAVEASLTAIKACDSRLSYHYEQPCKKTKQTIIDTQIKVYDAYTIHKDCSKVEGYLNKYNLRDQMPLPVEPTPTPAPAPTPAPTPVVDEPTVSNGSMNTCSNDEFSRLTQWSAQLDRANISIKKLGSQTNWKYDEMAVSNASQAVRSCETLMKYHEKNPCQKNIKQDNGSVANRQYTRDSIAERCQTSRKYFYEYVQNKETLMWPNAELFVDLSHFQRQRFEAQSFLTLGSCVAENRTDNVIDYSSRKARVVETRGFEQKMLVLITEEGLKIDCYGLDLDGPFSKTQVVKLLQAEGTDIRLEYRLK